MRILCDSDDVMYYYNNRHRNMNPLIHIKNIYIILLGVVPFFDQNIITIKLLFRVKRRYGPLSRAVRGMIMKKKVIGVVASWAALLGWLGFVEGQ